MPISATRLPVRSASWFQRAEWNELAAERLDALDVGQRRLAQRADGADEDVGREGAVGGVDQPPAGGVVPACARVTSVSNRCLSSTSYFRRRRAGMLDLGRGENERDQSGFSSKEYGVQVGRDVAGRARVGVVAPGAADLRPRSMTRKSSRPSWASRIAAPSPAKPLPTDKNVRHDARSGSTSGIMVRLRSDN